ncbi:hypothetical protein FALCPG4_006993 [Fusarium falciforme]
MVMDPPSDSDSHEGEPAIISRRRRFMERVNRKLPKSFGNQSQNDERQVTHSPTSNGERIQARESSQLVLPKGKLLEPETSKQLPNPPANSPRLVEESTQEEEYDTKAESTGAPNENDPTDSDCEGKPIDESMEEKLQISEANLRAPQ